MALTIILAHILGVTSVFLNDITLSIFSLGYFILGSAELIREGMKS